MNKVTMACLANEAEGEQPEQPTEGAGFTPQTEAEARMHAMLIEVLDLPETATVDELEERFDALEAEAERMATATEAEMENVRFALAAERSARADLVVSSAIKHGHTTEARRGHWVAQLANAKDDAEWDKTLTALSNANEGMKTKSVTDDLGPRAHRELGRVELINSAVEAEMAKARVSYDVAFANVKRQRPELFS